MKGIYNKGLRLPLMTLSLYASKLWRGTYSIIWIIALTNLNGFSQSMQQFVSIALDLAEQDKYDQSISTYDSAIKIYPTEPILHVLKGELISKLNIGDQSHYHEALKEFELALEIDSVFSPAYSSRGILNMDYKNFELAIIDFTNVLKLTKGKDEQFYAFGDRANAKSYIKDYKGAMVDYREALKQRPSDLQTMVNLGALYSRLKQLAKAEHLFKAAIELDPKNIDALNNLACLYIITDKSFKAIPILEKAIEAYPNEADLYSNLGLAKVKVGLPLEGLALINESLGLSAGDPYTYKHRAMAYIKLDQIEKACADLSTANQLGYSTLFDNEVDEMITRFCKNH